MTESSNCANAENSSHARQQQQGQTAAHTSSANSNPVSPSHHSSNSIKAVNRTILNQAAAAICKTTGFDSIQASALETLAGLLQKYMNDVCCSSRDYCEHTGRSMVTPSDVLMALSNSGLDMQNFPEFLETLRRSKPYTFQLKSQSPVKSPPVLRIAEPRPHPSHFPSFLPSFPDPHTYIRTEVKDDVDSNYEKVRRLSTRNKRDMENSLVNYALSVYPSVCVFQELARRLQFEAKDLLEQNERQQLTDCKGSNDQVGGKSSAEATNGQMSASELENGNENDDNGEANTPNPQPTTINNKNKNGVGGKAAGPGPSTIQDLLLSEEQFRLRETERSFVFKQLPPFCHILLPFEEQQPFIASLVTDDVDIEEEEHNYFASILSKEMEEDLVDNEEDEPMEVGGTGL